MTTYALPTTAPIGTIFYYNGDAVWFDGNTWQPIVTGSIKLNQAVEDIKALKQQINDLQAKVTALQIGTSVDVLEDYMEALENQMDVLEDQIYSLERRLNL